MQLNMLEARSLGCVRGTRLLFEDISFQIHPGEICQVRGTNGAGKTSLLRILCGLSLPEHGEVLWDGAPIDQDRARYLPLADLSPEDYASQPAPRARARGWFVTGVMMLTFVLALGATILAMTRVL